MNMPDPALLVRQLVVIAERERELLCKGASAWDEIVTARHEFDTGFAMLERAVQQRRMTDRERNDLVRLHHLHGENMRLAEELRRSAGGELRELTNVRKIGGYAPLGDGARPSARYLDGSA
jgi:hypothetical protein